MKFNLFMVVITMLMVSACNHAEQHQRQTSTFTMTTPIQVDTLINQEYVCQIRSIQHIEIRALEKGYLEKIYVDEGQFVKKGQLLFQIMPIVYQAETQKAAAELSFTEIEYKNTKALADSNIVSKNELALAKAKMAKAAADLNLAQAHLKFTELRAPFDGIVGRFNDVRLGSLLDEGELLTTLSDNNKMWVYFNVPEAEYISYKTRLGTNDHSDKVKLKMANNEFFKEDGNIETIEADFNNETGNIAFRATFNNPNRLLRHGETGNILMPVILKNALLIPQKATFEILDKKFVYVIDEHHKIQSREISIGYEMPHVYAVNSGLLPTDKILTDGLRKVKNGDQVKADYQSFYTIVQNLEQLKAE